MRTHFVLLIVLAALIDATPASAAPPVLGPADGVQATRTDTTLVVTFTGDPAKWKPLVGRAVGATCSRAQNVTGLYLADGSGVGDVDVGEQKLGPDGTLRYTLTTKAPFDICAMSAYPAEGESGSNVELAEAAVTPSGAVWLDESRRALALHRLMERAAGPRGYRPLTALGAGIVALADPDGTPGSGETGYWTDGKRATVVTLSAVGRRLVIQDLGQGTLRTNVLDQSDPFRSAMSVPTAFFDAIEDFFVPVDPKRRSPYRGHAPLLQGDGLRVGVAGRRVRIHFTGRSARAFRRLGGRRVKVLCAPRPAPSLFPPATDAARLRVTARIPRTGGTVALTLNGPAVDLCVVLDRGTRVALVAITVTGRRWLQDLAALELMTDLSSEGFAPADASSYWPTATVVARARKVHVAMPGPEGRVPAGRVGVWTDGARSAARAAMSASGWRASVVDEGDGMVRTNMLGRLSLWGALLNGRNEIGRAAAPTATS
jgi:hypothetical protein